MAQWLPPPLYTSSRLAFGSTLPRALGAVWWPPEERLLPAAWCAALHWPRPRAAAAAARPLAAAGPDSSAARLLLESCPAFLFLPAVAMPPLAPPHGEKGCSGGGGRPRQRQERAASFHGRGAEQRHQLPLQRQRPKTMPDLLAGARGAGFRRGPPPDGETAARTPSKVLVSVAVQRSMWPLHVMACAEWTVADLVAAAVALYIREGRRPLLPSPDPAAFGLHYSQFSLESLDPKQNVMELGSRNFFLCPKSSAAGQAASSSSSDGANGNGFFTVASGKAPAWLSYMPFWPMM